MDSHNVEINGKAFLSYKTNSIHYSDVLFLAMYRKNTFHTKEIMPLNQLAFKNEYIIYVV
jgi:hypothetical protein